MLLLKFASLALNAYNLAAFLGVLGFDPKN